MSISNHTYSGPIGFYGSVRQNRNMLLIYFLTVTLVLLVDVALALTVYQQRHVNTANIRYYLTATDRTK